MDNELQNNKRDIITAVSKATLGAIPFLGSFLAEGVGLVIANQRSDRLAKFLEALNERLKSFEEDFIRSQLNNEFFTDLLEESFIQASRALTDERRQYICSIVENGITSEREKIIESKQILRLLGEINDVEVIWLRAHMIRTIRGDEDFYEKHKSILEPKMAYIGASSEELDKHTLQISYKEHLVQLGLLECKYQTNRTTKQLEIDSGGKLTVASREITSLGRLLLKHIGLTKDGFSPLGEEE